MSREDNHEPAGFDPDWDEAGSSSIFFFDEDTERRPIKEIYSVFSRPRNDADQRGGELAARWGALDMGGDVEMPRPLGVSEEEWRASPSGEMIVEEGRVPLLGLGGEEDMLYAAPTSNDHIHLALLPNGGGGCGAPGTDGLDLHWAYTPSRPLVIYGLVGDEIGSVDVVIAGQTYAARMGENAFGIRVGGSKPSELGTVILHRRDGTTKSIPLDPGLYDD
ncbi:MAG: hypothetical protein ACREA0_02950 [bacterium]